MDQLRHGGLRPLLPAGILMLSAILVVAPWTVRNMAETGRLVPISTGAGQTIFSGSYLPSGGDPQKVTPDLLESDPVLARKVAKSAGTDPADAPPDLVFRMMAAQSRPGVPTDEALASMGRQQIPRQPASRSAGVLCLPGFQSPPDLVERTGRSDRSATRKAVPLDDRRPVAGRARRAGPEPTL